MRWTEDQRRAIEARGKNLLVAAAAGSGKTSVLVERVQQLVSEGTNIDEMLIVTFTRAASADMREKLRKRFSEMAAQGDARAREQMERLESASICTLHSFCTDVLRSNFEAAGIDPMFRILDDVENRQLTDRALDDALEEAYLNEDEAMTALDFARGPAKVRELVLSMHNFLMERPDPEAWFENAVSLILSDGSAWTDVLREAALECLRDACALYEHAIRRALDPMGPTHYADAMREDQTMLNSMFSLSYDLLSEALSGFKQITPKSPRRKKGEEKSPEEAEISTEVLSNRKKAKERVDKAAKLLSLRKEDSMADIRADLPLIQKIHDLALSLNARLRAMKEQKCALTFSDLEHYALSTLSDPDVAESVRQKYKFIFVDEYQDTSDVQEAIVSLIAGDRNRFMVGDVKQSIYRFREAEPRLFLEKYAAYSESEEGELIVLKQNFRSRKCVIDFVNLLFTRVMHGGASEIVYDDDQKLYQGAQFEGEDADVEMHIIDKSDGGDDESGDDSEDEELSDAEREGIVIAGRIRELMKEDPSLRYRDICVITRVRVNSLAYLAAALAAEGIPAYADASESYFDALEVMEILSALKLIVNRKRDIDLISVMRSPMFSFTSRALAEIRANTNCASFYDALQALREEDARIQEFFSLLSTWRTLSRSMPISRLIRRIVSDTGFYASVGALPGGRQRQANIDQLCARAYSYENSVGGSLSEFLDYALMMRAKGDGDGAHILGENDDVVRLMTSHKSKGLEFPVVFASLLGRRFREARADDQLLADRDLGAALMHIDRTLETRRDTLARRAIVANSARRDRAEELRIFYVTLTRAKSRLILTGTVRSLPQALIRWKIGSGHPDYYTSALDIASCAAMRCPGAEAIGASPEEGMPRVNVRIHAAGNLHLSASAKDSGAEAALEILEAAERGEGFISRIDSAIQWKYPDADRVYAPVKLTASGLARETVGAFEIPETTERPRFMSEQGLTPVERGTAVHAFLRAIDYDALKGADEAECFAILQEQLKDMLLSGKLLRAQANVVRPAAIARFLCSPIGRRLRAASQIQREWRFNLRLKASDAMPERQEDAEVIVQGSIDLCFLENGEWVLVDYKTDRADDIEALKARYRPQLRLYAMALERITGIRVKEIALCLVSQGMAINMNFNENGGNENE